MDLPQSDLARLLGMSENSIRGWENDRQKITKPAETLLRTLYSEQVKEDSKVRERIEHLAKLNRIMHRAQIELEETDRGWQAAA